MNGPPDYTRPLTHLGDVPVERGRVGAMDLGHNPSHHERFRPYVYRGTGEDTMEEDLRRAALDAEREQMETEAKAERRRLRQQADAQRKYARLQEKIKRDAERAAYDAQPLAKVIPLFPQGTPPVPVEPETPAEQLARLVPQPQKAPVRRPWVDHRPKPKPPAPGWKPLTGADLDDMFDDLD